MKIVRWLFVVPAAVLAWWGVLALGLFAHAGLTALCPAEQMISGACTAPWFRPAVNLLIAAFAGLAAAVVMVVATAMAPSRNVAVARLSLGAGGLIAFYMAFTTAQWVPLLAALLAGAVTLLRIQAFVARRAPR